MCRAQNSKEEPSKPTVGPAFTGSPSIIPPVLQDKIDNTKNAKLEYLRALWPEHRSCWLSAWSHRVTQHSCTSTDTFLYISQLISPASLLFPCLRATSESLTLTHEPRDRAQPGPNRSLPFSSTLPPPQEGPGVGEPRARGTSVTCSFSCYSHSCLQGALEGTFPGVHNPTPSESPSHV